MTSNASLAGTIFSPSFSLATLLAYQAAEIMFTSFHGESCVYDGVLAGLEAVMPS